MPQYDPQKTIDIAKQNEQSVDVTTQINEALSQLGIEQKIIPNKYISLSNSKVFSIENTDKDENSHGNSRDGDGGKREGYWIVKNQWSSYWGMGGYAYVAMGNNTCGILVSQISHSLPSALGRINAKLSFH